MKAQDLIIVGRFADSGETAIARVAYDPLGADPHRQALQVLGAVPDGQWDIIAVLREDGQVVVTQQSLRVYVKRIHEALAGP